MEPTENVELETIEVLEDVEMYEALERLEKNPDFQKVIKEGYLKKSVLDSVSLLAHPSIKQQGQRPDVMEDLVAASNLNFYLLMLKNKGQAALADLDEDDAPGFEG